MVDCRIYGVVPKVACRLSRLMGSRVFRLFRFTYGRLAADVRWWMGRMGGMAPDTLRSTLSVVTSPFLPAPRPHAEVLSADGKLDRLGLGFICELRQTSNNPAAA